MSHSLSDRHLFGEEVSSLELDSAVLTESTYHPGSTVPFHSHATSGFCFVLDGTLSRDYRRFEKTHRRGSISFHPSDEMHSEQIGRTGARLFSIQIPDGTLDRLADAGVDLDDRFFSAAGSPARIAASIHKEFRGVDELSPLAIDALLMELVVETCRGSMRSERGRPRWLDRVDALIEVAFTERLTLAALAAEAEVHPTHLARTFRAIHGIPVGEAIRQRRILYAQALIRDTDLPLADISLQAGFSSQGHMSTAFSRLTGLTPGEYRTSSR